MAEVRRNALDYHVLLVPNLENAASDEKQGEIRLVELWQDRRAVVCFFRHFGCRFCKQMAAGLNECYDSLQAHGIGLVAVGMGTIEQAQAFRSSTGYKGELYVDPHPYTPSTYKLFHLNSGENIIMDPYGGGIRDEVVKAGEKAMKNGFTDSSREGWTGSTTQAGGVFVLGPGNACDYMHRSKFAGDHPDLNELLAAATGVEQNGKMKIYASTQEWLCKLNIGQLAETLDPSGVYDSTVDILSHNYENALGMFVLVAAILFVVRGHLMIAAFVFLVACVVFFDRLRWLGRRSNATSCKINKLILYTPRDIDHIAYETGIVDCDCGFVSTTDVLSPSSSATNLTALVDNHLDHEEDKSVLAEPLADDLTVEDIEEFQKAVCYFREFLAKGHPDLGRNGPTCPFVPTALRKNSLHLAICRTDGATTRNYVDEVARHFLKRFAELEPLSGKLEVYKAILIIFPDVELSQAHAIIDKVQTDLKPLFVKQGLMIGEFHLHNNAPGLRNPNFYPLRTPSPCLAIRKIVPTDLAFLDMSKYSPEIRIQFLESYLKQFQGGKLTNKENIAMDEASAALVKARSEL
eukprot:m.80636 g.80636  ORF g.80636 m.80636 type:complete len:577 (-) comp25331_c0_seq1:60-1790(-)